MSHFSYIYSGVKYRLLRVLGFKLKPNGKLDIKTAGFGVRSDWLDLNDLCQRTGLQLSWQGPHGAVVVLNENIITDPHISTLAVLHTEDIPRQLSTNNVRVSLLHLRKNQSAQHWTGLKLQGKLALLQSADHSVSHSVLMNCSISEDILTFMIKARLQCLPTMYNLSIWYPSKYNSYCLLHENQQDNETVAHILNGCCCCKGLYDTHTHTHTHTLSLTYTHTHTHTLSLSLSHTHSLSLSLTHTLTLSHTHSLTHTHSLSLSHTHTLSRAHTHTLSLSRSLSLSHTHTHTHSLSLTHTLSHTHTLSLSLTHTLSLAHTHTHSHTLSLSLSLSLTHTHTHTHTLSHYNTLIKKHLISI